MGFVPSFVCTLGGSGQRVCCFHTQSNSEKGPRWCQEYTIYKLQDFDSHGYPPALQPDPVLAGDRGGGAKSVKLGLQGALEHVPTARC